MARIQDRHPANADGDWYVDTRCIDCDVARQLAPQLIERVEGTSVVVRQPETPEEEVAMWRAAGACPTQSIGNVRQRRPDEPVFPQEVTPGVFRCGHNARSSFGAHSWFARHQDGNILVDSPRWTRQLVEPLEEMGGIADILLTHRDDVADADRYAEHFGARVWIHEDDSGAAPYATNVVEGEEPIELRAGLTCIPVPGHTKGSVVWLLDDEVLFTGDSLAWSRRRQDLIAFRDATWYSWEVLRESLGRLANHRFEWVLAGHGDSVRRPAEDMHDRLLALVERMRE